MPSAAPKSHRADIFKYIGVSVGSIALIVILMMGLMRVFTPKIPDTLTEVPAVRSAQDVKLVAVEARQVPVEETAVGSVRPVHETSIAAEILAKVTKVNIKAGQQVTAGELLIELDDTDLKARLDQAQAALNNASAARDQAQIEFDRVKKLETQDAASKIEVDRRTNELRRAEATLAQAKATLTEAETTLAYAKIKSPITGQVIEKVVDVGDTVSPSQVLLTVYNPKKMQLVASVREKLAHRLKVGNPIDVMVESLGYRCTGQISEIVPEAESATRSFSVKVTGPCPPGVYPGMFGRLFIPLEQREILVIPQASVRRIGQTTLVDVEHNGELHRRAVQLGQRHDDYYEVLAGLRQGENVALQNTTDTKPEL